MKYVFQLMLISLVLSGCAINGQSSFENHVISMNETISDEHVTYELGVLRIDNEQINLPKGDRLSISYRRNKELTQYTVRVDGNLVREVEIANET